MCFLWNGLGWNDIDGVVGGGFVYSTSILFLGISLPLQVSFGFEARRGRGTRFDLGESLMVIGERTFVP